MKFNIKGSIHDFLNSYHLSKSKIYDLFINKKVTFEGKNISFDKEIEGLIDIDLDEELNYEKEDGKLNVLYEDEDFLFVSKEPHIIIHDEKHSLANMVANYYVKHNIKRAVRFPSRIDADTTGVVCFPKHFLASSYMDYLFREELIEKKYLALVYGFFKEKKGKINYNIGTDRHVNGKMVTTINGKEALTLYNVIKSKNISLVEATIKTGRTHQIRVHFAKINHPLLGDNLYGKSDYERVMLHAYSLEFVHPRTKEKLFIQAPLFEDMQTIIDKNFND